MGEPASAGGGAPGLPAAARLVNLTGHDVVLAAEPPAGLGPAKTTTASPLVCLPPDGRLARVDDGAARLGQNVLNTGSGLVRLTSLRRSGRLVALPPPQPGTRYVVSRVTALAARSRADLVFPFDEIRDGDGRITGAGGLASFRPRRSPWQAFQEGRAASQARDTRRPLSKQWLTGVLFACATALLSGTLGLLPGALDSARASGWGAAWQSWTLRLTVAFGVAGLTVITVAAARWRKRGVILDERGTAYVIEEQAITWRHEEKSSVLADVSSGFAAVLRVPGPSELDDDWRWEADARCAPQWDARVDQLVTSFWAVHYNDDQITRNAVFTWAPWPVAMAFGARATARRRGLVLHVRQRPSYGAGGPHPRPRLTEGAHDFLRREQLPALQDIAPRHRPVMAEERLTLTVTPLGVAEPGQPVHQDPGSASAGGGAGDDAAGLLLLVVRVIHGPVGPIQVDLANTQPFTLGVSPSLAGRVIPAGTFTISVAEWRLGARDADTARVPDLPWPAFPAAAEAIADWVVAQARSYSSRVVLLATRIPQELAVGLGVQLGQRSWEREPGQRWPARVYPVFHVGGRLVVPDLQLGADSVPGQRA